MTTTTCLEDEHSQYLHSILKSGGKPNHTKILGIDNNMDIRKQYLKLSKKYHPDKCKDAHAKELFLLVSNSFNVLSTGKELTLDESLSLFIKMFIGDNHDCDLFVKAFLRPKELSINDKLTLTCTIYKLFINKNE